MAKKIQKSFYLEKDVMSFIEQYQESHELSSISTALERILIPLMMDNPPDIRPMAKKENKKDIPTSVRNIVQSMRD